MFRLFVTLLLLCTLCPALLAQSTQDRYHRVRVLFDSIPQLGQLIRLGVAVDHGKRDGTTIETDLSERELGIVRSLGLQYKVLRQDIDQFYRARNDPRSPHYIAPAPAPEKSYGCDPTRENLATGVLSPVNYHGGSMGGFLTYSEMLRELDEMYAYSEANGLGIITRRADNTDPNDPENFLTENGHYQQWVRIGTDAVVEPRNGKPEVFYNALHHAREPASMQQLIYFMWYLLENYATDESVRYLVDRTDLYFMPCVNPDGYLYNEETHPDGGGMWRKNRRGGYGVDNNRNYEFVDASGTSVFGGLGTDAHQVGETYPGVAPFSEPETRGIRSFIESHNFKITLNNHSHGNLLLFPYGYDYAKRTPDDTIFRALSAEMVAGNGYANHLSSRHYPHAGNSDDFGYGYRRTVAGGLRSKTLAMTPEVGYAFWPAANHVEAICRNMLHHNLRAAQVAGRFYRLREPTVAIDGVASARLSYSVDRLGLLPSSPVVTVAPVSENILRVSPTAPLDTLTIGVPSEHQLQLTLSPDIQTGDFVEVEVALSFGDREHTFRVREVYGEPVAVRTDAGPNLSQWTSTGWGISTRSYPANAPTHSITDSPSGNYRDELDSYLELREPIDLSDAGISAADVRFNTYYRLESYYDFVQLQVSVEGSPDWHPLCGRHTKDLISVYDGGDRTSVYTGYREGWVDERISLEDYLGERVRLRFWLHTDESIVNDGFYINDFRITLNRSQSVRTSAPGSVPLAVQVFPNPVTQDLHVRTDLRKYTLRIHNSYGQTVRYVSHLSGDSRVNMAALPSGIYFVTISSRDEERTQRIVRR